ncbi:MAG: histidine--tRNA ligase [Planctomycetes bacterium]|nr:histidine--tRNA ligase [Planctomycetota bacterium]
MRAPRGTEDLFGEKMARQQMIENAAREVFDVFGYKEIRTPVFEDIALFVRGIGATTDIVEKEMYTLAQGDETTFALRPEGTASVMRAYVEHNLFKSKKFQKFYYLGPIFRHERPQAGRMRQFDQIGVEVIGTYDPLADVETILLAAEIFRKIELGGFTIKLNSFGCPTCRAAYRTALREALRGVEAKLCANCKSRIDRNVFRVLDCKEAHCKELTADAPCIRDHLDDECREHFEKVKDGLEANGLAYTLDNRLVRGLDYYTKTIYEIAHPALGARDAICGGGRYDGLVEEVGGPPTGGVGFAIGVVPTMLALEKGGEGDGGKAAGPTLFVIAIGGEDRPFAFSLMTKVRREGISADTDFEGKNWKKVMRAANRDNAKYIVVIGPDERETGRFKLKEMSTGMETEADEAGLIQHLKNITQ